MESQKPCMLANVDMGGVKPMSSTTACTLKIRGGAKSIATARKPERVR